MGLKISKQDKIEEVRVRKLPSPEDKDEISQILTDEPENAEANTDYATYLTYIEKKGDDAEQYFAYAVELEPLNAKCLGFYALYLELEKKDNERAAALYKKGYEQIICRIQVLGDEQVDFLCNYAIFQRNVMKRPQKADEYYKRLVASNPNHAIAHGDYGILLKDELQEYERADHHLKRAAEIEPNVAHWQLAYANFLKFQMKDSAGAKKYFTAAKAAKKFQQQVDKEVAKKEKERIRQQKKAMKD